MGSPVEFERGGIGLAVETLERFGRLRLRVTGTSMLPALLPGDVVSLQRCDAVQFLVGDLVLFRREERLVLHRILAPAAGGWLTQGDGMSQPDFQVDAPDLLGKVTHIERGNRHIRARHRAGWRLRAGRALFGRSVLAARIYLRWQRARGRFAA